MLNEPEQERSLVGATPSETGQKLSGWFTIIFDTILQNSMRIRFIALIRC